MRSCEFELWALMASMEVRECAKACPPKIGEGVFKPLHKNWPLEDLAAAQNPQPRKYRKGAGTSSLLFFLQSMASSGALQPARPEVPLRRPVLPVER